jgi:hypothetical protein
MKIEIQREARGWVAYQQGKSAPILRPVPGNTRPASAATWATHAAAVADLPALIGAEIELVTEPGACFCNVCQGKT